MNSGSTKPLTLLQVKKTLRYFMAHKLIIAPEVEYCIAGVIDWYNQQFENLGFEFEVAVYEAIMRLWRQLGCVELVPKVWQIALHEKGNKHRSPQ